MCFGCVPVFLVLEHPPVMADHLYCQENNLILVLMIETHLLDRNDKHRNDVLPFLSKHIYNLLCS